MRFWGVSVSSQGSQARVRRWRGEGIPLKMISPRRKESSHGNREELLGNYGSPKYLPAGRLGAGAFPWRVCSLSHSG